jgi:hypothetical protein
MYLDDQREPVSRYTDSRAAEIPAASPCNTIHEANHHLEGMISRASILQVLQSRAELKAG